MKNFEVALTKELCIVCTEETDGPLIMNSLLTEKVAEQVKGLHQKAIGFAEEPCEKCQQLMKQAFLVIGFDEGLSDLENLPEGFYRTGQIVGVKEDSNFVQKVIGNSVPGALEKGYCFMPHPVMRNFGLIENQKEEE